MPDSTSRLFPADVEESPRAGETADAYTRRVALDKARSAARRASDPSATVIAADTEVVADGRILGKPADDRMPPRCFVALAASAHDVLTAVVISANGQVLAEVVTTRVWFVPMSEEEIDWYVATGEPRGKAGGYAIQGLGARFIERIDGSWSNVVGLPIHTVHRMFSGISDGPRSRVDRPFDGQVSLEEHFPPRQIYENKGSEDRRDRRGPARRARRADLHLARRKAPSTTSTWTRSWPTRPRGTARSSSCMGSWSTSRSCDGPTRSITSSRSRATGKIVQRTLHRRGPRHVQGWLGGRDQRATQARRLSRLTRTV